MDGAAEGRGPDRGRSPGRAVEVDAAKPLRGKESPGVMGGRVRVVEGNAVEVDVVVAVREAAEVGFGLAEADAVAVEGESAGRHLHRFAVVGDGRGKVLNQGRADIGARGTSFERRVHRSKRSRDRADRFASTVTC